MIKNAWINSVDKITTSSRSWVLLEEPPIVQLLKNFPIFYGTRRFINVFTRALHWSLSWEDQSSAYHPNISKTHLILSTHLLLGLLSGSFLLAFPPISYMNSSSHALAISPFLTCSFNWWTVQVMQLKFRVAKANGTYNNHYAFKGYRQSIPIWNIPNVSVSFIRKLWYTRI
jgi:hypothetical protein